MPRSKKRAVLIVAIAIICLTVCSTVIVHADNHYPVSTATLDNQQDTTNGSYEVMDYIVDREWMSETSSYGTYITGYLGYDSSDYHVGRRIYNNGQVGGYIWDSIYGRKACWAVIEAYWGPATAYHEVSDYWTD
ncbi:MAG: hypothetical protein AB1Z23_09425 [Eubacteriales bacterium]